MRCTFPTCLLPMAALAIPLAAQEPAALTAYRARFAQLPAATQTALVASIERAIQAMADPLLQRLAAYAAHARPTTAAVAPTAATPWFETTVYAPVAKPRHLVAADDPLHAAATAGIRGMTFGPTLAAAVTYDWRSATVVTRGRDLEPGERFANYLHGLPPDLDRALAAILADLDDDPRQHRLADYFDHLYADREGQVFAGVTLFDAWHSGKLVEVPDTDAIAFARHLLETDAFVSPIPPDRRRARLYAKIRDAFADHRAYRTLRQALVATFAVADPELPSDYAAMLRRCHWLWQHCDGDPAAVGRFLAATEDRSAALHRIDTAAGDDTTAASSRQAALRSLASRIARLAIDALDQATR